jgi:hypothetical protein
MNIIFNLMTHKFRKSWWTFWSRGEMNYLTPCNRGSLQDSRQTRPIASLRTTKNPQNINGLDQRRGRHVRQATRLVMKQTMIIPSSELSKTSSSEKNLSSAPQLRYCCTAPQHEDLRSANKNVRRLLLLSSLSMHLHLNNYYPLN